MINSNIVQLPVDLSNTGNVKIDDYVEISHKCNEQYFPGHIGYVTDIRQEFIYCVYLPSVKKSFFYHREEFKKITKDEYDTRMLLECL